MSACDDCLRRAWLLRAMSGHLERGRRRGGVLALEDDELIEALGGATREELRRRHAGFDPAAARNLVVAAGLASRCRHGGPFPRGLQEAADAPWAIFVAGRAEAFDALAADDDLAPAVAVVGARRAAGEGEEVARSLGQELAAAGVCVVSGLALGIDSAAHRGALSVMAPSPDRGRPPTVAVLAGGADVVYPPSARGLYAQILRAGCVISELPPGTAPRKWGFPARNRIIAALAGMTVVVQARERSGSLITADLAMQLGRPVGAVPGPVTRPLSHGTNALLADGAHVVRDARDVLEALLPGHALVRVPAVPALDDGLRAVLDAVGDGACTAGELAARRGIAVEDATADLTRLELLGAVCRDGAGRYLPAGRIGALI